MARQYAVCVATHYPARCVRGALIRGSLRLVFFLGLAALSLYWADDEVAGNRSFLWGMAGLALVMAAWGLVETWRETKRLARGQ